jgi:hypothetical protein
MKMFRFWKTDLAPRHNSMPFSDDVFETREPTQSHKGLKLTILELKWGGVMKRIQVEKRKNHICIQGRSADMDAQVVDF